MSRSSSTSSSSSSSRQQQQPPHFRCVAALSAYVVIVVVLSDLARIHHPATLTSSSSVLVSLQRSQNRNSSSGTPELVGDDFSVSAPSVRGVSSNATVTATTTTSRIRYHLRHGPKSYQPKYSAFSCYPYPNVMNPLPTRLRRPGVVDFFPTISTQLKMAVVGDSVGIQIAHVLEEALGSQSQNRVVYQETRMANLVVSNPVRGGGTFLSYRVNGMLWPDLQMVRRRFRRRLLRRWEPKGGGRAHSHPSPRQLMQLEPQPWNRSEIQWALSRGPNPIQNVDVLVQRITFPWTPLEQITFESLERNTRVASEIFGMRTLVYVNFYFCNNVLDPPMHELFREKLYVVRNFTENFVPPLHSTLRRVMLLDMDRLVDLLNEENARSIGYDTVNEPFEKWMMSHYRGQEDDDDDGRNSTATSNTTTEPRYHHHYHAQVCGEMVPDHAPSCVRNSIFFDGMHFCPSTLGGRIAAGIACLIECAEQVDSMPEGRRKEPGFDSNDFLRLCERECNTKFMSLEPIPS